MRMLVYLDSSALGKRYLEERGSESLDVIYEALEKDGDQRACFSIWDGGEAIGAIDTRRRRGDIDDDSMADAVRLLIGETKKFVAMRKILVLPVGSRTLKESRELIVKYHIYQADALQLATAKQSDSRLFLTSDRRLVECAEVERAEVANPERDHTKIVDAMRSPSLQG